MSGAPGRTRFANGYVDDVAMLLTGTHPHAAQYIEQAPVLAILACQKMPANITYGELDRFGSTIAGAPRLKDLMRDYGATAPMRKLSAAAVKLSDRTVIAELGRLDNSTLSQAIPSDSQRAWLDGISEWMKLQPHGDRERERFNVGWIARQLGTNLSRCEQVGALIDFLGRGGGNLNERWSWDRAIEEVGAWHRRLRDESRMRRLLDDAKRAATFDVVICKSGLPDTATVEGLTFTTLRTIRQLRDEGATMHHCVASYASEVKKGRCSIVSVARNGVNIATLELCAKGTVRQLKAHCNQAVPQQVRSTCELYALHHWRAPECAA